jgi:DNA repair photolyase
MKPAMPTLSSPDERNGAAPIKGRGTATALRHRFARDARQVEDDGWGMGHDEEGGADRPPVLTQVTHEHAKTILSRNESPDLPFTLSLNPYRGCEHGCIYCYARPTHSYLNLSPGLDFETRLVAKVNAAECLKRELAKAGYQPSAINLGSATDCYQPVERELGITRSVLQVLTDCEHPFSIVTKSSGVERDLDLIGLAASRQQALVLVSITTLDPALCRKLEPRAAAPHRRLLTVRRLAEAGVPVGVNVAPIIPFLNEPEIEQVIAAAAEAGAASIHYTVVRLPWEVNPLFQEWLDHHVPDRAARIMARIRDMRGGKDYDADFAHRMRGHGLWAELIAQRVAKAAARHGLSRKPLVVLDASRFKPPPLEADARQGRLF